MGAPQFLDFLAHSSPPIPVRETIFARLVGKGNQIDCNLPKKVIDRYKGKFTEVKLPEFETVHMQMHRLTFTFHYYRCI